MDKKFTIRKDKSSTPGDQDKDRSPRIPFTIKSHQLPAEEPESDEPSEQAVEEPRTVVSPPPSPTVTSRPINVEQVATGQFNKSLKFDKVPVFTPGSYSLRPIISEVDSGTVANGPLKKIVTIRAASGRSTNKFFSLIRSSDRRFLVDALPKVQLPELAYPVNVRGYGSVHICASFSVQCLSIENANLLAEQLTVGDDTSAVLHTYLNQWLEEVAANEGEQFLVQVLNDRERIQKLVDRRATEVGIKLRSRIRLQNENVIDRTFDIEKDRYFKVQLNNINEFVEINYRAKIACYKPHMLDAIIHVEKIKQIPQIIARSLSKIIANHDYNLLYNSISPELIQAIKEQLNEKLIAERLGWQVEALVINKKDASFNLPEFVQIPNAVVEFPVKTENNQNVNIRVLNTIVLNLQDPEKAKTHYATVKQLEHETNERISRVVVSNLVNTTYADLIIDRSNYERNIRRELAEWANQLGYAIQNFITIPEVEKEKLGGRFDFSTDEDTEFVTQIGDRVKVQIIVQNARIGDPYQIKQYLTPDTDLRV
ncbi:MAG: hypothetical protein AAFZ63_27735, partial [Bacteroidota bacterium]